jgi:hypothetical protein
MFDPHIIGAATLFFVLAMIRELQPNEAARNAGADVVA